MNPKVPGWLLLILSLALAACQDQGSSFTVNIIKPAQSQVTNGTLDVRLELTGSTPNDLNSLTVILERRKNTDPNVDTSFSKVTAFVKGEPYPFTYPWDTNGVPDGEYVLRAKATYTVGGFDGQPRTTTSAPRTVTIDRSRPSVVSSTPAPDAGNVLVKDPITVVFNKAMKPESLTDTSVKLFENDKAIGRTAIFSSDGKTLTVTPLTRPATPSKLRLELNDGVTDALGNKLIPKAWSWDAPAWVRLGELRSSVNIVNNVLYGSFAIGQDGNPVAVWKGSVIGGDGYKILSVSRWNGANWDSLVNDLTVPAQSFNFNASCPTLRLDSSSNPIVSRTTKSSVVNGIVLQDIYVSHWNGTKWQSLPGLVATRSGVKTAICSDFIIDTTGSLVVAWTGNDGLSTTSQNRLFVNRWNGSSWESLGGELVSGVANAYAPVLSLDASNNLTIFSEEQRGANPSDIYVYRWNETTKTWAYVFQGLRATLAPSETTGLRLSAVVLDGNKYILGWFTNDGKQFISRQTAASSWTTLGGDLSLVVDASSVYGKTLALDSSNNLVMAITGRKQVGATVEGRQTLLRWDGLTWNTIPNLPPQPPYISEGFTSQLKRGPDGSLYVSWQEVDSSGTNLTIYRENR